MFDEITPELLKEWNKIPKDEREEYQTKILESVKRFFVHSLIIVSFINDREPLDDITNEMIASNQNCIDALTRFTENAILIRKKTGITLQPVDFLTNEQLAEFIALFRENEHFVNSVYISILKNSSAREDKIKSLPKVEKATTKTAQIPQSKIINYLFNDGYSATEGKHELEVSKDGAIAVKLELNELLDLNRLNGYDRAVYNAICNLWDKNGTHILTSEQILNFLSGNTLSKASDKSKDDVFKSIQKLMATVIIYDATEQIKMIAKSKHQNISDFKAAKGMGQLIKAEAAQVITKQGNIVDAYKIIGQPLLFYYSKEIGQIATYPVELNDVKDLALTTKNVALKDTILRLICIIKNENNNYNGNKIYLTGEKGIYNTLEPGKVYDKTEKKRIRDDIEKILKNCVEKAFIKKYEFIKVSEGGGTASKGREYNAIEIFI